MKKLFIPIALLFSLSVTAQQGHVVTPPKPASSTTGKPAPVISGIKSDIEKVARDYYAKFYYTKGDKIGETESTVEFRSKVNPAGAQQVKVIQYKGNKNDYSWQAVLLRTEDFDKASAKYKDLYRQLNGSSFAMHDGKTYKIAGFYDTPEESRGFASSLLHLDVKQKDLRRLKIEVALNYNMPEWTVAVYVYEKEEDEDMRPSDKEE